MIPVIGVRTPGLNLNSSFLNWIQDVVLFSVLFVFRERRVVLTCWQRMHTFVVKVDLT